MTGWAAPIRFWGTCPITSPCPVPAGHGRISEGALLYARWYRIDLVVENTVILRDMDVRNQEYVEVDTLVRKLKRHASAS